MGSYVNDGDRVQRSCEDAITLIGQVVTRVNVTTKEVKLVDADGELPEGVALMTTEDPLNKGTYLANKEITVVKEGVVICQVASDSTIVAGSPIQGGTDTARNGVVRELAITTVAHILSLLGYAEEAVDTSVGTVAAGKATVKVRLNIRGS